MVSNFLHTKSTLASKLLTSIRGVLISICVIGSTAIVSINSAKMVAEWNSRSRSVASLFADATAIPLEKNDIDAIFFNTSRLSANDEIISLHVHSLSGATISEYHRDSMTTSAPSEIFRQTIAGKNGKPIGYAETEFSLKPLRAEIRNTAIVTTSIMIIMSLSLFFVLRSLIHRMVSAPIQQFIDLVNLPARNGIPDPVTITTDDEFGILAGTFNTMMHTLKRNQEQMIHAQKMETIGTLAGGIVHDFNNILGGIIGNISLLRYKLSRGAATNREEIDRYLYSVENISHKADALTKQLMTLSRRQETSVIPVDLTTIISDVIEICKKSFDKKILITGRPAPERAMTAGDPAQIEQAILNVCINAAHSMTTMKQLNEQTGGNLVIGLYGPVFPTVPSPVFPCDSEIPYWAITVTDEGIGMNEDEAARVFDPFFTTKTDRSTGLGMTMVYTIISRHDGFITIDSQKGKGTSVTLHFPEHKLSEAQEAVRGRNDADVKPEETGLILVADDEDYIRQMSESILAFGGYTSITAADGDEAVRIFIEHQNEISLVVLDMLMPVKSGLETYNEIKCINPSARILFTSGLKNRENGAIADLPDDAAFLPKPYTAEQLLRMVDKLVTVQKKLFL